MRNLPRSAYSAWRAGRMSREQLAVLQQRRLTNLLQETHQDSRFYRDHWGAGQAAPDAPALADLPPVTKPLVRAHYDDIANPRLRDTAIASDTSGTTGAPLRVLHDAAGLNLLGAVWIRSHLAYGLRPRHVTGYFRNEPAARTLTERLGLFRAEFLRFEDEPAVLADQLRTLRPTCLGGYPNHFVELLRRLPADALADLGVRFITTGSESLDPRLRSRLESVFGATVVDLYGTVEFGCVAYQCVAGVQHVNEDAVVLEVLDEHGDVAPDGTIGEIVVTGLFSRALPLIRLPLGDRGSVSEAPCSCGSSFRRLEALQGRGMRAIVTPRRLRYTGAQMGHHLRHIPEILQYQLVQETTSHVRARVVLERNDRHLAERIRAALTEQLQGCTVDVEMVDHIERTAGGKVLDIVPLAS